MVKNGASPEACWMLPLTVSRRRPIARKGPFILLPFFATDQTGAVGKTEAAQMLQHVLARVMPRIFKLTYLSAS